ncbi:hypothetical protein F5Y08DRAFT_324831 [Xylaria arbuscula]|nr:hypothetical protein F5Y08DRAFT_324831 [Xylaria arbuscula]
MIEVREQRTNTALIKPLVIMSAMSSAVAALPATGSEESPQTRDPFDIDSDSDSEEEKEYTAKEVLVGCDQTLRWAFATVSRQLADKWRSQIDKVHPDSLESHRARFKTEKHWTKIQGRLGEEFKKLFGSDVPENKLKEVENQVDNHKDEIFDTIIDLIFKPIQDSSQEAEFPKTSPQEQRKRVNRTLKLMKQKATCYELLGVERDATEKQIKAAWKQMIGGLHPDQNKDRSAQECAQGSSCYNSGKSSMRLTRCSSCQCRKGCLMRPGEAEDI